MRVKRLEELSNRLNQEFIQANKGTVCKVLWESSSKNGKMFGYTGNYIRLEKPYDKNKTGTIEEVTI